MATPQADRLAQTDLADKAGGLTPDSSPKERRQVVARAAFAHRDGKISEATFKEITEAVAIVTDKQKYEQWLTKRHEYLKSQKSEKSADKEPVADPSTSTGDQEERIDSQQPSSANSTPNPQTEYESQSGNPYRNATRNWSNDSQGRPSRRGQNPFSYTANLRAPRTFPGPQSTGSSDGFLFDVYVVAMRMQAQQFPRNLRAEVLEAASCVAAYSRHESNASVVKYTNAVLSNDPVSRQAALAEFMKDDRAFASLCTNLKEAGMLIRPERLAHVVLGMAGRQLMAEQGFTREEMAPMNDHLNAATTSLVTQEPKLGGSRMGFSSERSSHGFGL